MSKLEGDKLIYDALNILKNRIVLIDRIDKEREAGRDAFSAVIEATVSFQANLDDHDNDPSGRHTVDHKPRPGVLLLIPDHRYRACICHSFDSGRSSCALRCDV